MFGPLDDALVRPRVGLLVPPEYGEPAVSQQVFLHHQLSVEFVLCKGSVALVPLDGGAGVVDGALQGEVGPARALGRLGEGLDELERRVRGFCTIVMREGTVKKTPGISGSLRGKCTHETRGTL